MYYTDSMAEHWQHFTMQRHGSLLMTDQWHSLFTARLAVLGQNTTNTETHTYNRQLLI